LCGLENKAGVGEFKGRAGKNIRQPGLLGQEGAEEGLEGLV